jgi:hypothetical protein
MKKVSKGLQDSEHMYLINAILSLQIVRATSKPGSGHIHQQRQNIWKEDINIVAVKFDIGQRRSRTRWSRQHH